MILEWIEYLSTPTSKAARDLGALKEFVSIGACARTNWRTWRAHTLRCHSTILNHAGKLPSHRTVVILGAGHCFDIPLQELSRLFGQVVLVDLAFSWRTRALAIPLRNVSLIRWDVTGALDQWSRETKKESSEEELLAAVSLKPQLYPDLPDVDLVISINLLSQLSIASLSRSKNLSDEIFAKLDRMLQLAHLNALGFTSQVAIPALLITDVTAHADTSFSLVEPDLVTRLGEPLDRWSWTLSAKEQIRHDVNVYYRLTE